MSTKVNTFIPSLTEEEALTLVSLLDKLKTEVELRIAAQSIESRLRDFHTLQKMQAFISISNRIGMPSSSVTEMQEEVNKFKEELSKPDTNLSKSIAYMLAFPPKEGELQIDYTKKVFEYAGMAQQDIEEALKKLPKDEDEGFSLEDDIHEAPQSSYAVSIDALPSILGGKKPLA